MNTQLYNFPYGFTNYEIMPGEPDSEEFFSNYTEKSILNAIPQSIPNEIPQSIPNSIPESISIAIPESIPFTISKYYNPSSTLLANDYQCQLTPYIENIVIKIQYFMELSCSVKIFFDLSDETRYIIYFPNNIFISSHILSHILIFATLNKIRLIKNSNQ